MGCKNWRGYNHRMGLYDAILIKDNHIDYSVESLMLLRKLLTIQKIKHLPIIVEVRNLDELNKILKFKEISRIILDNFKINEVEEAVKIVSKNF